MKEAINNYAAVHAGKQVRQVTFDPMVRAEPRAPQVLQISADSHRDQNIQPSVGRTIPWDKYQPCRGRSRRSRSRRLQELLELIGPSSSNEEKAVVGFVQNRTPGGRGLVCYHCSPDITNESVQIWRLGRILHNRGMVTAWVLGIM